VESGVLVMDAEGWAPSALRPRSCKFYALKSTWTKPTTVLEQATNNRCLLPRLDAAESPDGRRSRENRPAHGDDLAVRLIAKRDAALAQYRATEEELQRAREGLSRETRARVTVQGHTKDLLDQVRALGVNLQSELGRIRNQQIQLRELRSQLKALQNPHAKQRDRAPPVSKVDGGNQKHVTKREGLGEPSSRKKSSNVAASTVPNHDLSDAPTANPTVATSLNPAIMVEPNTHHSTGDTRVLDNVDIKFDGHLAELQMARGSLTHGNSTALLDEEEYFEADIELLRLNGVSLARMQHPSGCEVCVDLRDGFVSSWHLLEEGIATAKVALDDMVLLWPEMLAGPLTPPWRLTLLDDCNNEPSITLSCGGDGTAWWFVHRKWTLGGACLREELLVENLCSSKVVFDVFERAGNARGIERPESSRVCIDGFQRLRPKSHQNPAQEWPSAITLAPGGLWQAKRTWSI